MKNWIIAILIIIVLVQSYFLFIKSPVKTTIVDNKIDSIYLVKDSIINKIDTVYYKIEANNEEFEKDLDIILNNVNDDNYLLFVEYINTNKGRLDSLYLNSRSDSIY